MLPTSDGLPQEDLPPKGTAIFDRIDDIKRERNLPLHQKMTAAELIEKYREEIAFIHQAGRPQSDVYIYLESQEGKLVHADDTLRKAINKIIKSWRNRPSQTAQSVAARKPAPFADRFNVGGEQW